MNCSLSHFDVCYDDLGFNVRHIGWSHIIENIVRQNQSYILILGCLIFLFGLIENTNNVTSSTCSYGQLELFFLVSCSN